MIAQSKCTAPPTGTIGLPWWWSVPSIVANPLAADAVVRNVSRVLRERPGPTPTASIRRSDGESGNPTHWSQPSQAQS